MTNVDVVIAQVDCDKEGALCDKFNVQVRTLEQMGEAKTCREIELSFTALLTPFNH